MTHIVSIFATHIEQQEDGKSRDRTQARTTREVNAVENFQWLKKLHDVWLKMQLMRLLDTLTYFKHNSLKGAQTKFSRRPEGLLWTNLQWE